MAKIRQSLRKLAILDFDIENRPLSYWYDGMATAEITAIAWSWCDSDEIYVVQLGVDQWGDATIESAVRMLNQFRDAYDRADVVTGHYIRRHDLPILNSSYLEYGYDPLPEKMVSDTKLDLRKRNGLSVSQEALGAMLGLDAPKIQMTQSDWREANRRTPEGIEKERERVTGDVRQHKEMRAALVEMNWLGPPKLWRP